VVFPRTRQNDEKVRRSGEFIRGPLLAEYLPDDIENSFHFWKECFVTLDKTPIGSAVRIISIEGSDVSALRLMEMGMVPGAPARVIKSAPLGDPIQICVRDYHLALRRNEARTITVALCD
jgi:ferrous iron transport protein A